MRRLLKQKPEKAQKYSATLRAVFGYELEVQAHDGELRHKYVPNLCGVKSIMATTEECVEAR